MKILNLSTTNPAGSITNMCNAINRTTEHTARLFTFDKVPVYNFDTDLNQDTMKKEGADELIELIENSDTIIIHKPQELGWNDFKFEIKNQDKILLSVNFEDLKKKKIIFVHHGEPYVRMPEYHKELQEKYEVIGTQLGYLKIVVVTPELLGLHKHTNYIPNCVPINDLDYLSRQVSHYETKYICHAPTATQGHLKNTNELIEAYKNIEDKYLDSKLMILQGMSKKECLRKKRIAYIGFDHMQGYYGLNTLEFLSMGIPCITGLSDDCIKNICLFFNIEKRDIPILLANNILDITRNLGILLEDKNFHNNLSKESRLFMQEVWNEQYIANKFINYIKGV